MKYQEVNKPKTTKIGQLRVWHKPQVPMQQSFFVYVDNIKEAKQILEVLAIYDLFQYEYKIKPDYSNAQGLQVYEDKEWVDWQDEDGNDIDDTEIKE